MAIDACIAGRNALAPHREKGVCPLPGYDVLGRATDQYVGYNLSAPTYAEAQTVVNDTISYNRQGQQSLVIDQRGCQHAYDYDGLGRQIHDRVPSLGTSAVGSCPSAVDGVRHARHGLDRHDLGQSPGGIRNRPESGAECV